MLLTESVALPQNKPKASVNYSHFDINTANHPIIFRIYQTLGSFGFKLNFYPTSPPAIYDSGVRYITFILIMVNVGIN